MLNRFWKAGKLLLPPFRSYSCCRVFAGRCNNTSPAETGVPLIYQFPQSTATNGREIRTTLYQSDSPSLLQTSVLERRSLSNTLWLNHANFIFPEVQEETLDECESEWNGKFCGSVLKKRRSKMNKHKYKKRRKKFKFLRRALGK